MPPEVKVRLSVEGTPEALAAFRAVQEQAQRSGRAAAAAMAPLNASLATMKNLLTQLGLAATLAGSLVRIVTEVRAAVEIADKLGETAERLTSAVKDFVPLVLQAKTAGVELDVLEQKMAKFAKQLWELRAGNPEVVAAFRAIGLSAKSFDGRSLAQSFTIALEALGRVRDSYQKGAVAQLVFSKGAEDLIPLANDVAKNGIDPLRVKIGQLFDERQIARIRNTGDEMDLLGYTLKGVLASSVAPAFWGAEKNVRLLSQAVLELQDLLSNLNVAAWLVVGVNRLSVWFLTPLRVGIEKAHQELREFKLSLESIYEIGRAFASGGLAAARRAELIAEAKLMALRAVHAEKLKEIAPVWWNPLTWVPKVPEQPGAPPIEPPEPPGKPKKPPGATAAQLSAAAQAELEATRAKNAALEAEAKRAYDAGETSLQAHFTARRDVIESNLTAELALLTAEWERAQKIADPAQRQAALDAIGARTDEATAKADKERTELDAWYLAQRQQLERTLADLADKRRAAEEREHENKLREIAEIQRAEAESLFRLGTPREEADAQAAADAETLRRAEDFRHQLATARTELETLTGAGTLSDEDLARFRALAEALEKAAQAIGPEAVKAAQDFTGSVTEAGKTSRELTDYGEAVESSLTGAFRGIGDEIKSASDLLRNFLQLLAQAIAQASVARLATAIVSSIPGLSAPVKKASGGLVFGPGTGTSDSIPALLSAGEYVVRAAAVRQAGVLPMLEQLNRNPAPAPYQLHLRDWSHEYVRRYAEGGLVLGQRSGQPRDVAVNGEITVRATPGTEVLDIRTPRGQRVQIQNLALHRRAALRALGLK